MSAENDDFLAVYGAQLSDALASLHRGDPPTILRIEGRLILRSEARKWQTEVTGPTYRALMRACHVPALWALAYDENNARPASVRRMVEALAQDDPPPAAAAVLEACRASLHAKTPPAWDEIEAAFRDPLDACIQRAAALELADLHAATHDFLQRTPRDIRDVHFVVCAGHQPRYRELSKQYFHALLEHRVGKRAVNEQFTFAENRDEADALKLVAARQIDRRLGQRIWSQSDRMERDVLGTAATAALRDFDFSAPPPA